MVRLGSVESGSDLSLGRCSHSVGAGDQHSLCAHFALPAGKRLAIVSAMVFKSDSARTMICLISPDRREAV